MVAIRSPGGARSVSRQVRQTVAAFIRQILTDPAITVHPQSSQSFLSGLVLYEARPDKEYSLTDCISCVVQSVMWSPSSIPQQTSRSTPFCAT